MEKVHGLHHLKKKTVNKIQVKPIQKVQFFFEGVNESTGEVLNGSVIENVTGRLTGIRMAENTFKKRYGSAVTILKETKVLKTIKPTKQ